MADPNDIRNIAQSTLQLIQEFKKAQDIRSDLDRVSFEILMLVKMKDRIRPSDLAAELDVNPSSITRRLQPLLQAGLVGILTDPEDLRSSLISLTAQGDEALNRFLERSVDGLGIILKEWGEEDIHVLAQTLGRYAESMKDWRLAYMKKNS
ncbi:hypothetical protein Back11_45340 [Paenibacillus baekrokdamisoli]|uniref:Uncharacterized protein n=1 Tax=Paenibacillus baekrokdamisoli TaxID=1712516 RepID=A0A3G9JJK1_9BACL|nr:MarR family transcriptional regulator [Paenibacillus baekrokdamisoli]MBB3072319.1 DNA-binding MarR family transcriptional regulator [Paenibacillus baekrokdamisoli]BBH23189.1 hypothetical protein Back11_45340 [Paenibacillus baekrokdamisoli]